MSTRYYHVGPPGLTILLPRDVTGAPGTDFGEPPEPEDSAYGPLDADIVCLFRGLPEAKEFRDSWRPDGYIYVIDWPDWEREPQANSEGYPYVYQVPAEYILGEAQ